jgi:hypothetical protein
LVTHQVEAVSSIPSKESINSRSSKARLAHYGIAGRGTRLSAAFLV